MSVLDRNCPIGGLFVGLASDADDQFAVDGTRGNRKSGSVMLGTLDAARAWPPRDVPNKPLTAAQERQMLALGAIILRSIRANKAFPPPATASPGVTPRRAPQGLGQSLPS